MKILITGASGMLSTTLIEELEKSSYEVIKADLNPREGFVSVDITSLKSVSGIVNDHKPDILINCAAYTNVEKAEDEKEINNKVNGDAVGLLAKLCKDNKIKFLHISTDYVFGHNSPAGYSEDMDPGESQNEYGKGKRSGEILALGNNPDTYICRTSWIFGKNGKNYIDTMLMLAETKSELNIVDDEVGVPTSILDISRQLIYILKNNIKPGIYHLVNEGSCSRFEESRKLFELAGKDIKLGKMKLADYPRKAKIPNYSILLNTKLPKLQSWEEAIEEYIKSKGI